MEVAEVLHMVGGVGEKSYASNSLLQRKALAKVKPMVEQTLADLFCSTLPKRMSIVDFGCSSGPNALVVAGDVVDIIGGACRRLGRRQPEIQYFFNDLPANDFNTLFTYLTPFLEKLREGEGGKTVPLYPSGLPGSFYGRLFPEDSIDFALASYCLHWISQVPPGLESNAGVSLNKGNIYLSSSSPIVVCQSYMEQFQKDFTLFLKSRSEEIVVGGCMVLVIMGREHPDPSTGPSSKLYKLLADALVDMASEGLVEEGKADSFNLPVYTPSIQEVRAIIEHEGSFDVINWEKFEQNWDPEDDDLGDVVEDALKTGENVAKCIRAVVGALVKDQFGEAIIDGLFSRYAQKVATHLSKEKTKHANFSISLKKRASRNL